MNYLRVLFAVIMAIAFATTVRPEFVEITNKFGLKPQELQNIKSIDQGNQFIAISYFNGPVKLFRICEYDNTLIDVTDSCGIKDVVLQTAGSLVFGDNEYGLLVAVTHQGDGATKLFQFSPETNCFIDISSTCGIPVEKLRSVASVSLSAISVIRYRDNTVKLFRFCSENKAFIDISNARGFKQNDLLGVEFVAASRKHEVQYIVFCYTDTRRPAKLFIFNQERGAFFNISKNSGVNSEDLQKAYHITFSNNVQNQLMVITSSWESDPEKLFRFDLGIKKFLDISPSCGLSGQDLHDIESFSFSDNQENQLLFISYVCEEKCSKLFQCDDKNSTFSDISNICGINSNAFQNAIVATFMQDDLGTTMFIRYGDNSLRIFYESQVVLKKNIRIKSAHSTCSER